jgi:hypothetical protein
MYRNGHRAVHAEHPLWEWSAFAFTVLVTAFFVALVVWINAKTLDRGLDRITVWFTVG